MSIYKGLNKYKIRIIVVILLTFGNALGELFFAATYEPCH